MTKFKLPEPVGATYTVDGIQNFRITKSFPATYLYTQAQLTQAPEIDSPRQVVNLH